MEITGRDDERPGPKNEHETGVITGMDRLTVIKQLDSHRRTTSSVMACPLLVRVAPLPQPGLSYFLLFIYI
jgi:hypothetical protein